MGYLLVNGKMLSYRESQRYMRLIKRKGLEWFVALFKAHQNRKISSLHWGDEIEYSVLRLDHKRSRSQIAVGASDLIAEFDQTSSPNE